MLVTLQTLIYRPNIYKIEDLLVLARSSLPIFVANRLWSFKLMIFRIKKGGIQYLRKQIEVGTLGYQINVQHVLFVFQNFPKIKNFLKPISLVFVAFSITF